MVTSLFGNFLNLSCSIWQNWGWQTCYFLETELRLFFLNNHLDQMKFSLKPLTKDQWCILVGLNGSWIVNAEGTVLENIKICS